jgi:chemotaxis protein MotA
VEISTVIGLGGAFAAVIFTLLIEGGNLISFVNFGALILILGGSVAVGIVSFGIKELVSTQKYIMGTIFPKSTDFVDLVSSFISFSEKARREGLLSLEQDVETIKDDFINLGMKLVIDGTDPAIVKNIMEQMATAMEEEEKVPAQFFETLGGFSPTLGIIGTVMGLVHVLEGLSASTGMETLGRGIAVAFIATFYGIGFANLIWLPLSNKVKRINIKYNERRAVIIQGVLSIQSGENPRIVKDKLICQLSEESLRKKVKTMAKDVEGGA